MSISILITKKFGAACPIFVRAKVSEIAVVRAERSGKASAAIILFYLEEDLQFLRPIAKAMVRDGQLPKVYIYQENGTMTVDVLFFFHTKDREFVSKVAQVEDIGWILEQEGNKIPESGFRIVFAGEAEGLVAEKLGPFLSQRKKDDGKFTLAFGRRDSSGVSFAWEVQLTEFMNHDWHQDASVRSALGL